MKPNGLTIGTAITAPRRLFASSSRITRRTTSTPLSSSPWIAPEIHTWGPCDRPLMTTTGKVSVAPVTTLAKGSSILVFRPGRTVVSPTVIGSLRRSSGTCVVFDVLDDQGGYVDTAGALDALEPW